jgi:transposase-like protein
MTETRKVTEIQWRQDLYPRFEPNQTVIQRYSESTEFLPPIKINQANILIDGFHRWKAHQLAGLDAIACEVIETASEKELKALAYRLNSNHGLQLSDDEKRAYAQEMYGEMTIDELAALLSVGKSALYNWTTTQRKAETERRNRQIVELYLRAGTTLESIAKLVGVTHPTVGNSVDSVKNCTCAIFYKTFWPLPAKT